MRILWISHSGGLLGAERSLVEGAKCLSERGVDVHAVVVSQGLLADKLTALGISISVIPSSWWVSPKGGRSVVHRIWHLYRNLLAAIQARALIEKIRPDLIITNTLTIPFGALAAWAAHVPHVWYIHEFGSKYHGLLFDFGKTLSFGLINKLSIRVIVNSRAVSEKFKEYIPPDKLRIVPYAVDVPDCLPTQEIDSRVLRLSLVGAMTPGKRQEDAIKAVASLAKRGINTRLDLVGSEDREYGSYLRRLADELGVSHLIEFVGFTDDPYSHFAASDIVLMCSKCEAFGRVTVEAMKLGKPVIGAASGGTIELIKNGWNGFLYQVGNVEDLSRNIEELYRNRDLLDEMSRNAKAWANRTFNFENFASALLKVFEEAIDTKKK